MNISVEKHLDELIEYYKGTSINDVEYLKKLIVRNLGDVKRRYVKYDKPKIDKLQKVISEALKMIYDNYGLLDKYQVEILEDILKGNLK